MLVGQIIKCGLTCEGVDIPQNLLCILVQEKKRHQLTYKSSIFSVVRSPSIFTETCYFAMKIGGK